MRQAVLARRHRRTRWSSTWSSRSGTPTGSARGRASPRSSADGHPLAILSGEGQRDALDALDQGSPRAPMRDRALHGSRGPASAQAGDRASRIQLSFPGKVAVDPEGKHSSSSRTRTTTALSSRRSTASTRAASGSGIAASRTGLLLEVRSGNRRAWRLRGKPPSPLPTRRTTRSGEVDLGSGVVRTVAGTGKHGHSAGVRFPRANSRACPGSSTPAATRRSIAMAWLHQIWRLDMGKGTIGPLAGDGSERRDGWVLRGVRVRAAFRARPSRERGLLTLADSEFTSSIVPSISRKRDCRHAGGGALGARETSSLR